MCDLHLQALYQIGRTGVISGEHLAEAEQAFLRYLSLEGPLPISREAARWRLGNLYELMDRCRDAEREYQVASDAGYLQARRSLRQLSCEDEPR